MQAKDVQSGEIFTVWEHEAHVVCLKTQDGRTYRLKDGSVIQLAHNRNVERLAQEERGFQVVEYHGRLVLAKRIDGADGSTARYVVKSFVALESSFVIGEELRGIGETSAAIRKEVNTIPPQIMVMLQELESTLQRGTSFLQVVKLLLAGSDQAKDVYHNQIMGNFRQFPTE